VQFLVLANKKPEETVKKGKGYKDAQWEAEVRKSLASKQKTAGSATLSKQDQALVQAQLEKESKVRKRVASIKRRIERGLALVRSLVQSKTEELRPYVHSLVDTLLGGAFTEIAAALVSEGTFETYLVRTQQLPYHVDSDRSI
jgi:anti-sigma28 factor (negative regulator of flagellin synthesis)